MSKCFNCGAVGPVHNHHVVPRSLGGISTVPLCPECHGKAHGREQGFRDTGALTRAALGVKRDRGERTGEVPYGKRAEGGRLVDDEAEQAVIARVREARSRGRSVRAIAEELRGAGIVSRRGKPLAVSAVGELVARAEVGL